MNYSIEIPEHNKRAHMDIEHDIQEQKDGLFTFILRVNNSNIVDYNVVEYVDITEYVRLKSIIIEEYVVAHHYQPGSEKNPVRTDNGQRTA